MDIADFHANSEADYTVIAPHYDWIMTHVDYGKWASYLKKVWKKTKFQPKKILELGAGTCPFHETDLYPKDSQVIYTDISWPMLQKGREKGRARR